MTTLADDLRALLERPPPPRLKMLFYDIETAPAKAFIWQARTDYVGSHMIEHETFMLTWAAKWADDEKVISARLTPEEALARDDSRIVIELADLIRQADVICAHNVDRFDLPMMNNRLLLKQLPALPKPKTVDTLKLAKRTFRLLSNKLDWLAQQLGFGNKIATDFNLWKRCYDGDEKALKEMLRYNRKDVTLLQQVYEALEPYAYGIPRLVDADGRTDLCPTCGSDELTPDPVPYRTNASTFPTFLCGKCGRRCRARKADKTKALTMHPL